MSKRPKTANAVMSRLRRPAGRLRDLPIWSKLGLIMLVPTLATIIVGTSGLIDHIDEASNAERARTLAVLSQAAGGLVDHLQNERAYGVMIATTKPDTPDRQAATQAYNAEHPKVDAAKLPYAQQKAALDEVPDQVATLLSRLNFNLEELPSTRSQTANGQFNPKEVDSAYSVVINDLLNVRDASAQLAQDTELSDRLRVVAAVARAKDYISRQRDVGHRVLGEGRLTPDLRRELLLTDTGYTIADSSMRQVATNEDKALFDRVVKGPAKRAATNLTGPLAALGADNITAIPFDRTKWESAMVGYNGLFRTVETDLDQQIVAQATDIRDRVQRQVFIETSVLLGMLLLAIVFAWIVARSMARSLRELRQGALNVAQFGLPQAVERLRDPALTGSLTPAQVADQVAEPLPVRSRDEFGQVTEAFNAVHLEAVRTAAEQAALRSSVATMFVNLARRSQILVDRLIGHLDRLERGEEDPDRLAELFQLDHLATRMRRNDENLLVLAGADSTRVQREPAALIDVLRAAQSEVEHYTRIEFGMIDRDIEVSAHAVNDMVHLVAELFDNATAFSPPNSHVVVEARRLGDGAVLSVEDRGIGISREQLRDLNERLANPPMVDVAVSRMMGLVVVARLANRHGVKVELRPADTERGTVADVGLPAGVMVTAGSAGRLPSSAAPTSFGGADHRPAFAEPPLALESGGRGGYPGGRPFDPNPPMPSGGMLGTGAGRSVPAWSDLTGAPTNGFEPANGFGGPSNGFGGGANGFGGGGANGFSNGSTGANGFHGPRSNEPIPPLPQSGPQGFAGNDGLPQRRNGDGPRPEDTGAFGHTIPRQLPPSPETPSRSPFVPPVSAPPVPPVSAPPVPSAPPYGGGRPVSSPPVSGPPTSAPPNTSRPQSAPPNAGRPQSAPPASPPAWPPVSGERDHGTPHVPESLAAALDMTAELPRYRPERSGAGPQPQVAPPTNPQNATPPSEAERSAAAAAAAHEAAAQQAAAAQATAAAQIAAAQAAARQRANGDGQSQFADETMELPIFRELESAWFTTARPSEPRKTEPKPSAPSSPSPDADVVTTQRFSTGEPARQPGVPQQAPSPETRIDRDPATVGAVVANGSAANGSAGVNGTADVSTGNPWQTAADEGWQAARKAAEMPVETTTTAGLPRRTPMAQLVPGGVDRAETSVQRRTPEAVRGLLSAYHRGVQRGRTKDQSTNPEETPGGQQSSQAGKEHEA
ncbi:nitrate- and nitrite sensing domain-containing protein [Couchioplanes caeruleus]|uniref:sensor histidine kinase n=1 Tax=Couchioplanes caeruleus TaxID=56438 RepID=UPI0020BDA1C4|nr:nitrate- and nitrite sensing domain-containing protein [Couchioplanes caeruleus]UQU65579.1 nitrate- and nitrite sensing domain-containing protein [Couchioplanes caeruleus]